MTGRFGVAILLGAMLCSGIGGQVLGGADWLRGLSENIDALNRNVQRNVQQLNQRITETVHESLAQANRFTENLNKDLAAGSVQRTIGGSNVVSLNNGGTKLVHSGRTSDGKPFVRESWDTIVGDTLRRIDRIYDPTTNVTREYGYELDLKNPNAKPVPIRDTA